jgi:hypothetical protein
MHLRILGAASALFTVLACSSGGSGGDAAAPTGSEGGASDVAAVVTYQDVKPIFMSKCTPCHSAGGVGAAFHTLADSYQTANNPSENCPGKKIGECTIVLVKSGYMPLMKGCTGDPTKDVANSACLTAAEQQLLEAWIAGGLKEK